MALRTLTTCAALLALTMVGSAAAALKAAYDDRQDVAEIAKIEHALVGARSGADMRPYLDPNHTFIWDVTDRPRYGREEVVNHIDQVLATPQFQGFKNTAVHVEIEAGPRIAFANSIQHVVMTNRAGKVLFDSDYRVTDTYHKVNGKWLVVGEHASYPIDFATGKAIFGKLQLP